MWAARLDIWVQVGCAPRYSSLVYITVKQEIYIYRYIYICGSRYLSTSRLCAYIFEFSMYNCETRLYIASRCPQTALTRCWKHVSMHEYKLDVRLEICTTVIHTSNGIEMEEIPTDCSHTMFDVRLGIWVQVGCAPRYTSHYIFISQQQKSLTYRV